MSAIGRPPLNSTSTKLLHRAVTHFRSGRSGIDQLLADLIAAAIEELSGPVPDETAGPEALEDAPEVLELLRAAGLKRLNGDAPKIFAFFLRQKGRSFTPVEVANQNNLPITNMPAKLKRLADRGLLKQTGKGTFTA